MKVSYYMGWMKHGTTPNIYHAMVHETGIAGWFDKLLGRKSYRHKREYVGNIIWFKAGTKKRAPQALEEFLENKTQYADLKATRGSVECIQYPFMVTFKHN